MIQSYLKIAFRNLRKNRVFSLVNIAGLGLGIAAFLLILQYVGYERSVNTFHKNLPTLYRMMGQNRDGDFYTQMAPAMAPLIKKEFPEVRDFCRVGEQSAHGVVTLSTTKGTRPTLSFREDKIAYADGSFFRLFSFPLVQGSAATALTEPNTVALSASKARTYFGNAKPEGRTLTLNNQFGRTLYTITAVYADMPKNSDLSFDAVFSLQTLANPANLNGNGWARLDGFDGTYLTTFLQLAERADYQALEAKLDELKKKRTPRDESRFLLQPATNMHLAASLSDPYQTSGSLKFVYLLSGIAGLILVIAWFNYINLSTAGALKRAKEVGVRKVVGAGRSQLIGQFLGESLLLNLVGFGVAFGLVKLMQEMFNEFIQKELSLSVLLTGGYWFVGLAMLLGGALASGSYVAFAMTSFQPVQTLKGTFRTGRGGWLRKTLVVTQFGASVALVVATLVLYRQLSTLR